MKHILFLDDDVGRCRLVRSVIPSAIITHTVIDTIDALRQQPEWDLVSLDHDLGGQVMVGFGREDCGMEVARWIIRHKPLIQQIWVHSFNIVAGPAMQLQLAAWGYTCWYLPFDVKRYEELSR